MKKPRMLNEEVAPDPVPAPRREGGGGEIQVQVRCPLCRYPLVALMTRSGPRFVCACPAGGRKPVCR